MKFADYHWANCEPSYDVVLAAAYLEAKGYIFGQHFDCANVLECAENVYQLDVNVEKQS